jgi:hypothetical protein
MRRSLQDSAKLQKESAAQRGQSMSMLHGHVFMATQDGRCHGLSALPDERSPGHKGPH